MIRICWHKWSDWSVLMDVSHHFYKMQVCKCKKCNKIKQRYICFMAGGSDASAPTDKVNELLGLEK